MNFPGATPLNKRKNMSNHESYMARAIKLAEKGRGEVSPNPMVGCVLVKDGEVIGEGYHQKFGEPHAEVMAFRNAIRDPLDCTVYVNLEPCNIDSKNTSPLGRTTGSCFFTTQASIKDLLKNP